MARSGDGRHVTGWRAARQPALDNDEAADLWRAFDHDRSVDNRNHLVVHYSPLVRRVAMRSELRGADVEDLVGSGTVGLIRAVERFDRGRGARFASFAYPRIRGAMVDHVRQLDTLSRRARRRIAEADEARRRLELRLDRTPTDPEIAEDVGLTVAQVRHAWQSAHHWRGTVSLDAQTDDDEGVQDIADAMVGPEVVVEDAEQRSELIELVNQLPERLRFVVAMVDVEERTLAQTGEMLGVSESRVCQLRREAVHLLRALISASAPAEAGASRHRPSWRFAQSY
jgi:RNA polymerase sigma factor for flagellar operon FliA